MNRSVVGRALLSLLLVSLAVSAGSFIVPADRDLIDAADAIAVVTIRSHHSYFDSGGLILTDYVASVSDVVKGDVVEGGFVVITEVGGAVGDRGLISSTAPRFADGQRALVLLDRSGDRWTTHSGLLGKFDFVRDASSATFLVRGATDSEIFGWDVLGNEHVERLRVAEAFLDYVSSVARGEEAPEDYFREAAGPV
ncbi:MAG: hypothetical protein LC732_12020, partial [Acidobacteria bacterium]|nr:hypothetical protein [Acidobacteriota bacterium]